MSDQTSAEHPPELPFFVTGPGETDILLTVNIVALFLLALLAGVFYMRLHSVPDRMAHHANHAQLQLIGILTLIALVTHNNLFWVAALVIAAINPPDLMTPLRSMAASLQRMAHRGVDPAQTVPAQTTPAQTVTATSEPQENRDA